MPDRKAVLVVSYLDPRKDVSIVFIWENSSMTGWLIDGGWDTVLVLVVLQIDGWYVVSEQMLDSILSVSIDPHDSSLWGL